MQDIKLKDKLITLARYGQLLEDDETFNPYLLQEIGQDSMVLLQQLCDTELMQQLFDSGLLKEMIDKELLRRVLGVFRLWVNIEASGDSRAKSAQPQRSKDGDFMVLSGSSAVPVSKSPVSETPESG